MKNIFLLLFSLFITANVFSQNSSHEDIIKNIYSIRDSRDPAGAKILLSALKIDDKDLVIRSLSALADIADSNSVNEINALLGSSSDDDVQKMCAFALGQINTKSSVQYLETALNISTIKDKARAEVLNSLGKIGSAASLELVSSFESSETVVNEALALSIGRFAGKKIVSANGVLKLKKLFNSGNINIKRTAAYAFFRIADAELLKTAQQEIYDMTKDSDSMIRSWGFGAMGRIKDGLLLKYIQGYNKKNKDQKVDIARINALAGYDLIKFPEFSRITSRIFIDYFGSSIGNIKISAMDAAGRLYSGYDKNNSELKTDADEISESLKQISLLSSQPYSIRASALINYSKIKNSEAKQLVMKILSADPDYNMKRAAIDASVFLNDPLIFKEMRESITKVVQRYADSHPDISHEIVGSEDLAKIYRGYTGLLTNYIRTPDVNDQNILRLIFGEFLSSKDAEIVSNCIQGLSDSIYVNNAQWNDQDKFILDFEFKTLELPKDFDVMTSFIDASGDLKVTSLVPELVKLLSYPDLMVAKKSAEALKKITGDDFTVNTSSLINEDRFNRAMIRMNEKYIAEVNTNKGKIVIELFNDIAPMSASNFIDLSESGYYNGTIFHRVVPNFVIQGGDNTGTGFGSPNYSIRSEFSPLNYERGVVGMASSGKDTEGAQFFITHSPQYHLDGKYTIFGFVTDGMEVVDKIIVGDKIENVKIMRK
ncbi:peptidylprolyl isomerase [soil metagenome]